MISLSGSALYWNANLRKSIPYYQVHAETPLKQPQAGNEESTKVHNRGTEPEHAHEQYD